MTQLDELGFWAPDALRQHFPEPNPLFYESANWGAVVRRERMQVLTGLAAYHLPSLPKPERMPILVAPVRAVMTRTLPRRDFLINARMLKLGTVIPLDQLVRRWVEIGYQPCDIVVEPGQFSRRGGILDIWPPASAFPVRLEFFGDEIDTLRSFNPATQRTIENLKSILVSPAREYLPGKANGMSWLEEGRELNEFDLPRLHPASASLMDYLPRNTLILVDDLEAMADTANEIEEQAVRFRTESIHEGTLAEDFPVPYLSWSEMEDSLDSAGWLELGRSTAGDHTSALSSIFTPGRPLWRTFEASYGCCRRLLPCRGTGGRRLAAVTASERTVARPRRLSGIKMHPCFCGRDANGWLDVVITRCGYHAFVHGQRDLWLGQAQTAYETG